MLTLKARHITRVRSARKMIGCTGAANFSASGLKRQDNDLIVIESAKAAAAFKRAFDARFASRDALWFVPRKKPPG